VHKRRRVEWKGGEKGKRQVPKEGDLLKGDAIASFPPRMEGRNQLQRDLTQRERKGGKKGKEIQAILTSQLLGRGKEGKELKESEVEGKKKRWVFMQFG